jgi:1-acyl-sn-glycerol-3-phosphate acyltransferase
MVFDAHTRWLRSVGPLRLDREIRRRLSAAPLQLNEYGYDPYGLHVDAVRRAILPVALLYRYYFRVETYDIDKVPSGRFLLIGNHAGQMPYDGAMLTAAMLIEADPPRLCRGMGEYFLWKVPWMGVGVTRVGGLVGTPVNCVSMLKAGECVMVFPEGARGANKPFRKRYRLERFGQGFMRLALETDSPIVPVAIVGAEEQQPGLANFTRLAEWVGLPSLPITVTFPWLGPLGLAVALPVKYRIYFGEPLHFQGHPGDEDEVVQAKVEVVRQSIADLIARGRRERRAIFW